MSEVEQVLLATGVVIGLIGLLSMPIWIEEFWDWFTDKLSDIKWMLGRWKDSIVEWVDALKTKYVRYRYHDVLESVQAEPMFKETIDGKTIKVISVKVKSGSYREIYAYENIYWEWYFSDSHERAPSNTDEVLGECLRRYRIDNAKKSSKKVEECLD